MTGNPRTHHAGRATTEAWYRGLVVPGAPRDAAGEELLAGERQENRIGVAPAFMTDIEHIGQQGSFGDIGNVQLSRNGELVGGSGYPFGVFTVPAEDAAYELTLTTRKTGSPAAVWKRSTPTETTWKFRSERKPDVASQGLPLLFPRYDVPADGMRTVPAQDRQRIGLTATGHAGYTPGRLSKAAVSFSYDGGETWHAPPPRPSPAAGGRRPWTTPGRRGGRSRCGPNSRTRTATPSCRP